jgi:hypothetical protein
MTGCGGLRKDHKKTKAARHRPPRKELFVNATDHTTVESDFQTCNHFAEADELLAAAIDRIAEGRTNNCTGAVKTCTFLIDLLQGRGIRFVDSEACSDLPNDQEPASANS